MANVVAQLVNAVAAELNRDAWPVMFTAAPNYRPKASIEELATLRAYVSPGTYTEVAIARNMTEATIGVLVGLQQKIESDAPDAVEPMIDLSQAVLAFMRSRTLSTMPGARWFASEVTTLYSPEHLDMNVFTSVLTLTYRLLLTQEG